MTSSWARREFGKVDGAFDKRDDGKIGDKHAQKKMPGRGKSHPASLSTDHFTDWIELQRPFKKTRRFTSVPLNVTAETTAKTTAEDVGKGAEEEAAEKSQ